MEGGLISCLCHGISEKDVDKVVARGACSVEEISKCTGAGTDCGSCYQKIRDIAEKKGIKEARNDTRKSTR